MRPTIFGKMRTFPSFVFLALILSGISIAQADSGGVSAYGYSADPWDTQALEPEQGRYNANRANLPVAPSATPPIPGMIARLRSLPALTAWALQHNPQTAAAWASLRAAASH